VTTPAPVLATTASGLFERLRAKPHLMTWICLFTFVGLVAPTVVNYRPCQLAWDEAYYLGRIICVNQAFYSPSWSHFSECMANTKKGPILTVVNLPWGRTGGEEHGIGLAFVGLALLVWTVVLTTYGISLRGGISLPALLLAALAIASTPLLRKTAGAMMTDTLLGWSVALALMLIPLEYSSKLQHFWPSFLRGLFWGFVMDLGMLNKVTFVFFLGSVWMILLVVRQDYSGERPLWYTAAGCLVGSAPALLIWRYYGANFLRFAAQVAWGEQARLWSVPGLTPLGYLLRYFSQLGFARIPLSILFALFIRGIIVQKQYRFARLLPIGIILAYLGIAARSQNRDPRFAIPVMIALPVCLAWTHFRERPSARLGSAPVIAALILVTAVSIPMVHRPELAPIRSAGELLTTLSQRPRAPGRPVKVVIATDGPAFNIDTFLLARQVRIHNLQGVALDTLVYDKVNRWTLEAGLKRIDAADFVLFLRPDFTPGAGWQRIWAGEYRAHTKAVGTLLDSQTSPEFDVFKIRASGP
jgi:hypothetical protein